METTEFEWAAYEVVGGRFGDFMRDCGKEPTREQAIIAAESCVRRNLLNKYLPVRYEIFEVTRRRVGGRRFNPKD